MQLKCIRAFGGNEPGDVVDGVPDGAAFDPVHWEAVTAAPVKPAAATAPAAAAPASVKAGE